MSSLPTLVLNHGSWHTPAYWDPVKVILESKGYKVVTPRLLFNDTPKPTPSMAPVIRHLQSIIATELDIGNKVVLVNHSFGGFAGVSAVKGFTRTNPSNLISEKSGHVVGLVQVTAFTPPSNTSLVDVLSDPEHVALNPSISVAALRPSADGWLELHGADPRELFYNDLTTAEAQKWISQLVNHSAACPASREGIYAGWLDVPTWYLLCTDDQAIVLAQQERMVAKCREAGADVTTRRLEAGHSPMLSNTAETAEFIEEAVKAFET